jgi:GH43 family beta-xylosidase
MAKRTAILGTALALVGCADGAADVDGGLDGASEATGDGRGGSPLARRDAAPDAVAPCTTQISYGSAWIHPKQAGRTEIAQGDVRWDGTCVDEGPNSYALLSNGWKPYFQGHSSCALALDHRGGCANVGTCATRITYGSSWLRAPNHPANYDDVSDHVYGDGVCHATGATSHANLSNGWRPNFSGSTGCALSFRWQECGGLFENPVLPVDCPDPGVLRDGTGYLLACTGGSGTAAFPLFSSPDLVHWTPKGHIFTAGSMPTWATGLFWAPEIHKIGAKYVAYYSARGKDGVLAIGAATAAAAGGPYTDLGKPLVHDATMGLIDASEITANGKPYLLWKEDGNAKGKPTPIHAQQLAADGLSLLGTAVTLITNDRAWEGSLVEAPFMVARGGYYYLFYSANGYATPQYAVGVARATSPLGPFTKAPRPLVVSSDEFSGPGHCSVVDLPNGSSAIIYHAWLAGKIQQGPGRVVLVDEFVYDDGWPLFPLAPSRSSRALP